MFNKQVTVDEFQNANVNNLRSQHGAATLDDVVRFPPIARQSNSNEKFCPGAGMSEIRMIISLL